jgi:hypothetical protein
MGVGYLSKFIPEKLSVNYRGGVTATAPLIPRRYTLTHSDITGELFLTIGIDYAWDKVNHLRDEVLGEWKTDRGFFYYCIYLYVDQGEYNQTISAKRNEIFRRELPLALMAIRYGDRLLFDTYPHLEQSSIIVNFMSAYHQFARQEDWGNFNSISIK